MSDSSSEVAAAPADVGLFRKTASDCQRLALYFGNRQNSDSTLTARECTGLVTALLNAGNLMAEAAARTVPAPEKELPCPPNSSPAPTSPTPPSSPPSATN